MRATPLFASALILPWDALNDYQQAPSDGNLSTNNIIQSETEAKFTLN